MTEEQKERLSKLQEIYPDMQMVITDGTESTEEYKGDNGVETYVMKIDGVSLFAPKLVHRFDGKWMFSPEYPSTNLCSRLRSYAVNTFEEAVEEVRKTKKIMDDGRLIIEHTIEELKTRLNGVVNIDNEFQTGELEISFNGLLNITMNHYHNHIASKTGYPDDVIEWAIKWYKWKSTEPVFGHES